MKEKVRSGKELKRAKFGEGAQSGEVSSDDSDSEAVALGPVELAKIADAANDGYPKLEWPEQDKGTYNYLKQRSRQ